MQKSMRKIPAALVSQVLILGLSAPAVFSAPDELLRSKAQLFEAAGFELGQVVENMPKLKLAPQPANVQVDEVPGDRCVSLTLKGMAHYVCEEFALTLAQNDLYVSLIGTRKITKAAVTGAQSKLSLNPTQVMRLSAAQKELFLKDPRALLQQVDLGFAGLYPSAPLTAAQKELLAKDPRAFYQRVNADFTGYNPAPVIDAKKDAASFSKLAAADFAGTSPRQCGATACYLDENGDPITASEIMDLHFQELQDVVVDILKRHASQNP